MLYKPQYDENGKKVLCEMNGVNADMLMDIYVQKLKKGAALTINEDENETAILLLSGKVRFTVGDGIDEICERENPFQKTPYAVHFCHGTPATVEALDAGADIIMLDNMDNETMRKAVAMIDGRAETECSGNVTKERLKEIAAIGVDFVSCGALTHSAPIMDISLKNLQPIE